MPKNAGTTNEKITLAEIADLQLKLRICFQLRNYGKVLKLTEHSETDHYDLLAQDIQQVCGTLLKSGTIRNFFYPTVKGADSGSPYCSFEDRTLNAIKNYITVSKNSPMFIEEYDKARTLIIKKQNLEESENANQPSFNAIKEYRRVMIEKLSNVYIPLNNENKSIQITEIVDFRLRSDNSNHAHQTYLSKDLINILYNGKYLFVTGEPGAGKSTFAKLVAYSLLQIQDNKILPIYLELKVSNGDIYKPILALLKNFSVDNSKSSLNNSEIQIYLILDGLDEVTSKAKFYESLTKTIENIKILAVLLTSRKEYSVKDTSTMGFSRFEILPSTEYETIQIFDKVLDNRVDSFNFKNCLKDPVIRDLAKNKLFLYFLIIHYIQTGAKFKFENKGILLRDVIETHFFKTWETGVKKSENDNQYGISTDLILSIAQKAAYFSLQENSLSISRSEILSITEKSLKEYGIKENLFETSSYILQRLAYSQILESKDLSSFVFINKVIQEFLAASEMVKIYERTKMPKAFYLLHASTIWIEPLSYFSGLIDNPSYFIEKIYKPFTLLEKISFRFMGRPPISTLRACARMIGANQAISPSIKEMIINDLEKSIKKFMDKNNWTIVELASDLSTIDHEKVADIYFELLKAIQSFDNAAKEYISGYLKNVNLKGQSSEKLLDLYLQINDTRISGNILAAMEDYVNTETVQKLKNYLNSEGLKRHKAWFAFKSIDSPFYIGRCTKQSLLIPIVYDFIQLVLSSDDPIHDAWPFLFRASPVIEKEFVLPLLDIIKESSDREKCRKAICALRHVKSNLSAQVLFERLRNEESDIQYEILFSLQYIPTDIELQNNIFDFITKCFDKKDSWFQSESLTLLGKYHPSISLQKLEWFISKLLSNDGAVRAAAAETLGRLKVTEAVEYLKAMVGLEKMELPWSQGIWALMNIQISYYQVVESGPFEDAYIEMLSNKDINEVKRALDVLSKIGTKKAFKALEEKKPELAKVLPNLTLPEAIKRKIKERMDLYYSSLTDQSLEINVVSDYSTY